VIHIPNTAERFIWLCQFSIEQMLKYERAFGAGSWPTLEAQFDHAKELERLQREGA
jgi:hypothetical protein